MIGIIKNICDWNEARYDQQHDSQLTFNLLSEELDEFFIACKENNKVEQIDGLVDIIYVSIGALWKLGLSAEQIQRAIAIICTSNNTKAIKKTASDVKANINKGDLYVPPTEALTQLVKELENE